MRLDITALFVCLDDFCRIYQDWERHRLIGSSGYRHRSGKLSLSEMLLIVVLFHVSPFKDFKPFYLYGVCQKYRDLFGDVPDYDRFIQILPTLFMPLTLLIHLLKGEETGIYYTDSTKLAVCHNRRISRHRVFKGIAARGKTSMGWFFGFKLHLVFKHKGQIVAMQISPGNKDDRKALEEITATLRGKIYADRGYIGAEVFKRLYARGLQLITGIRRNMKNYLMPIYDKLMLRRRGITETIFDIFKSDMNLEHSRHRSPINAIVHTLACLVAYVFRTGNPTFNKPKKRIAYP